MLEASVGAVPRERLPGSRVGGPGISRRSGQATDEHAAAREMARLELQSRLASPEIRQMFAALRRPAATERTESPAVPLLESDAVSEETVSPESEPADEAGLPADPAEASGPPSDPDIAGPGGDQDGVDFPGAPEWPEVQRRVASPELRHVFAAVQPPPGADSREARDEDTPSGDPAPRPASGLSAGRPPVGVSDGVAEERLAVDRVIAPTRITTDAEPFGPGRESGRGDEQASSWTLVAPAPDSDWRREMPLRARRARYGRARMRRLVALAVGFVALGILLYPTVVDPQNSSRGIARGIMAGAVTTLPARIAEDPDSDGMLATSAHPDRAAGADTGSSAAPTSPDQAQAKAPGSDPDDVGNRASAGDGQSGAETVPQPVYASVDGEQAGTPDPAADPGPVIAKGPDGIEAGAVDPESGDPQDEPVLPEKDRDAWREVQQRLAVAGFHPGSADGIPGPRTREAILGWQRENGLTADGILDAEELALLERNTEDAYRALLETARSRSAAGEARGSGADSSTTVHRSASTGRYIDGNGCLREPDGRAVPFYKPGCV